MSALGRVIKLPLVGPVIAAALLLLAVTACGGSGGDSRTDAYGESNAEAVSESSVVIAMKGLRFLPQGIKVSVGTTVTWRNEDAVAHNVRQIQSEFLSPDAMEPGQTFTYTFDRLGTYRYQCTFHHPDMNGVVIVEEAG